MFKSAIFPYGITLREGGRVDTFPAVEVSFAEKKGDWLSLFLIIDSGAMISALPATDGEVLGVSLSQGVPMKIYGIGHELISGWRHEIKVRLWENKLLLPTVFLDNYSGPRILGREGIFGKFLILFNESRQRTGFISEGSKEEEDVNAIIDKVK